MGVFCPPSLLGYFLLLNQNVLVHCFFIFPFDSCRLENTASVERWHQTPKVFFLHMNRPLKKNTKWQTLGVASISWPNWRIIQRFGVSPCKASARATDSRVPADQSLGGYPAFWVFGRSPQRTTLGYLFWLLDLWLPRIFCWRYFALTLKTRIWISSQVLKWVSIKMYEVSLRPFGFIVLMVLIVLLDQVHGNL